MSGELNNNELMNGAEQRKAEPSGFWRRNRPFWLITCIFLPAYLVMGLQFFGVLPEPAATYILFGVFLFQCLVLFLAPFIAGAERQPRRERTSCDEGVGRRKFNFGALIKDSVTLKVCAATLAVVAMMVAMFAAIAWICNDRAIDALIDNWPSFALLLGSVVLWLAFYNAGLDPDQAFKGLYFAAAIGTVGFVAGMVWTASTQGEFNSQYRRDAQREFRKGMMGAPMPCLVAQDNLSDLSACTIFRLRPGMTQGEALGIVDGSGYFRKKEKPVACKTDEKCSHYVSFIKDGLHLRVEFKSDPKSAAPDERVSEIVLSLNEEANPYFDENQMMASFLKLIGPNGISIDTSHTIWVDIKNALELSAYTYEHKFWAIFSLRLADHSNAPSVRV